MANPVITPASYATSGTFTVTQSTVAYFDIYVPHLDTDAPEFTLDCPVATTVLVSRVASAANWSNSGATFKAAGASWTSSTVTFGGALDQWSVSVGGTAGTTATFAVANVSGPTAGLFRILVTGLALGDTCTLTSSDGFAQMGRVMAGPKVYGLAAALTVYEGDPVALTGNADHSLIEWSSSPPMVLSTRPLLKARWPTTPSPVGNPTLSTTPQTGTVGPLVPGLSFTAPPVYDTTAMSFSLEAFYDLDTNGDLGAGEPNTSSSVSVTVQACTHHMLLVLDRSGSMEASLGTSSKWEQTKVATRLWADLFGAFRVPTTSAEHRLGILTFEHGGCGWGTSAGAGEITLRDPSSAGTTSAPLKKLSELPALSDFLLGIPGTCTPIGDALVAGIEAFHATPAPTQVRRTMLLMTDGYGNSGRVTIKSNTEGGGSQTWSDWRTTHLGMADYATILNSLRLYTLGVGTTIESDLLSQLPSGLSNPNGLDFKVTEVDASQLLPEFALMLSDALGVEEIASATSLAAETESGNNVTHARYFTLNAGEQKLAIVVNRPTSTHGLRVVSRLAGGGSWSQMVTSSVAAATGVSVVARTSYYLVVVDLATALGASPSPASDWKVQLRMGAAGDGAPLPITSLLGLQDLYLATDFSFDDHHYRTGDLIRVSCRLYAGNTPVTNAKIRVEVDAPAVGLGTFLAEGGARILARTEGKDIRFADQDASGDRFDPKQAQLVALLADRGWTSLPLASPPPPFADGTDRLHDDGAHGDGAANDGLYANTFASTLKEGVHTFRFHITGTLDGGGGSFHRVKSIARWVGVKVDSAQSPIAVAPLSGAPAGMQGLVITLTPKDARGEFLGPYHADEVKLHSSAGTFDGPLVGRIDGSYSQVLLFKEGEQPVVTAEVGGVPLTPTVGVSQRCPRFCLWLQRLWRWFLRLWR